MFLKLLIIIILTLQLISLCLANSEWNSYEREFEGFSREETFIANVTSTSRNLNFPVKKWKTLNAGFMSYTAGILNQTQIVLLLSLISNKTLQMEITNKTYDMKLPLKDLELFSQWQNGKREYFLLTLTNDNKFRWYSIDNLLNKLWTWPATTINNEIANFHIAKIRKEHVLIINSNSSIIIYGFNVTSLEHWLYQSIPLASKSSCISSVPGNVYFLSIVQASSDKLVIYQLVNNRFTPLTTLDSPSITQTTCFENGFQSFMAINGLKAAIYELTTEGPIKMDISNSNLEGIEFWLPIKIDSYRDETLLLLQRKLDYSTHHFLDVDLVVYNGKNFEEHDDVPCFLYGEEHSGLKCLTELNPIKGIIESSYIAIEDTVALIVPNLQSSSEVFIMKIGIKKVEHPAEKDLMDYIEIKNTMEILITKQRHQLKLLDEKRTKMMMSSKKKFPHMFARADDDKLANKIEHLMEEIDQLKPLKIKTIIFNGPVNILNTLTTINVENHDETFNNLLKDFIRSDDLKPISSGKSFKKLSLKNLQFENVNGIFAGEFVKSNDGNLEILGNISFDNSVKVGSMELTQNKVNNVDINNWVNVNNIAEENKIIFDNLKSRNNFDSMVINNVDFKKQPNKLSLPGNVTVGKLNGQNFEDFLKKLCLKNVVCHIPKLRLSGILKVKNNVNASYLNGLKYPEDYVELHSKPMIITGSKQFKKVVSSQVTTNSINNVKVDEILTISDNNSLISQKLTFEKLEVVSDIEIHGNIKGEQVEKFLPNVGLNETRNIQANVEFQNLEITGQVFIKKNFNTKQFGSFVDNFLLKTANSAFITGTKSFPLGVNIQNNLNITSNTFNGVPLSSFITKNTPQNLTLNVISGKATFDHLHIEGLFDGQNITNLNETLLKLDSNQTVNTHLVFDDDIVVAQTLSVEEIIVASSENVEYVEAENVVVKGDFTGTINNVENDYLKYEENQVIDGKYFVNNFICDELKVNRINDLESRKSFSYEQLKKNVTDILLYRNATVETLLAQNNLHLKNVNNNDFDVLLNNHPWLALHKNFSSLTISGDVYFENSLQIDTLASAPFEPYVKSLIFKNQSEVFIAGSVKFEKDISINNLLEARALNDIALENILRKSGNQLVTGSINVLGNVAVEDDVEIKETINDVNVTYLLDNFKVGKNSLEVKGEILFQRLQFIRNLTIDGLINGKSFENIKSQFVYTNKDVNMEFDTIFQNEIQIDGNLRASHKINNINLSKFLPRVVWITQDTSIQGSIKFMRPLYIEESMVVEEELSTKFLFNKNLAYELSQGVNINEDFLNGTFNFEEIAIHGNLNTSYINNMDMEKIVNLKSDLHIPRMDFDEITVVKDFDVKNDVNGVKLKEEIAKSVLSNTNEYLQSEIVFLNNVLVEDTLESPKINGKPSEKIVTTDTNQNLTATYYFKGKTYADEAVKTAGLVNGINLTKWKNDTLAGLSEIIQTKINEIATLNIRGPLNGSPVLNNFDFKSLIGQIEKKTSYLSEIQKGITSDYNNLCEDLKYIHGKVKRQIYKFEYFEEFQTLLIPNPIGYVKRFLYKEHHYLLINEKKSCFSHLYVYENDGYTKLTSALQTGPLEQVVLVTEIGNENLFLVGRTATDNETVCNDENEFNTNIWAFSSDSNMKLIASIEPQDLLQDSQMPHTFYGLKEGLVIKYTINLSRELPVEKDTVWHVLESNARFVPRGLKTGLALTTGTKLLYLEANEILTEKDFYFTNVNVGNVTEKWNQVFSGREDGDMAVVKVGAKGAKKTLLAVARRKQSEMELRMDVVEIYSNPFTGTLFGRIQTLRPTNLISLEFRNGETLLMFLEDNKLLQIYEFKGIEGIKHRSSIKVQASKILLIPMENGFLGLVQKNKITLLKVIMSGDTDLDNLNCGI